MDYFVLPLPLPLFLPLPSVRGESGGLVSEGVSLPLRLPLPLPLPFPLPLPLLSGGAPIWVGEVGVIVKERGVKGPEGERLRDSAGGGVAHLKRERAWSSKGLAQAGGR